VTSLAQELEESLLRLGVTSAAAENLREGVHGGWRGRILGDGGLVETLGIVETPVAIVDLSDEEEREVPGARVGGARRHGELLERKRLFAEADVQVAESG